MARVAQCLQVLAVVVFTDAPWFYVVYLIAAIGSESLPTTSCHTWQARQACAAHALLIFPISVKRGMWHQQQFEAG